MNTMTKTWQSLAITLLVAGTAVSAEDSASNKVWNVKLDGSFASCYMFRGDTINDGFVFQPALVGSAWGQGVGVWGNYNIDDYAGALEKNAFTELDYFGFLSAKVKGVHIIARYTDYTYSSVTTNSPNTNDNQEVSLSLSYPARVTPFVIAHWGLDGNVKDSLFVEGGLRYAFFDRDGWEATLSGSVAYWDQPDGPDGFKYFMIEPKVTFKHLYIAGGYMRRMKDELLVDSTKKGGGRYDMRTYGMFGFTFSY